MAVNPTHQHLCFSYRSAGEFQRRAAEFLAEGLALGLRVRLVGSATVPGLGGALDDPAVEVVSVGETYQDAVVDPQAQVRAYAQATEEALAAGYRGLRIAAEATGLVRTPEQLAAFLGYEHLVDRYMAEHPFSALCGYHAGQLSPRHLACLAAVHPATNSVTPGFQLHATGNPAHSAALGGELDPATEPTLTAVLDQLTLAERNGQLIIDADGLTFLDHGGLLQLARHARRAGAGLVLLNAPPGAARIAELLDLTGVRVEEAA